LVGDLVCRKLLQLLGKALRQYMVVPENVLIPIQLFDTGTRKHVPIGRAPDVQMGAPAHEVDW